jgi:ABC-type polysaccharide/polyol phosphate transport system ATPase subunit
MQQIIKSGTTVVLVSHDLTTVSELADRVIWLKKGEVAMAGKPSEVIAGYQKSEI